MFAPGLLLGHSLGSDIDIETLGDITVSLA